MEDKQFIPYLPMVGRYAHEAASKLADNMKDEWINHKAPACREFQRQLEDLFGRPVLLTHSDTGALDVVLQYLRHERWPNKRIYAILPATAFIADLWACLKNDIIPVLIDVRISNGIMPTAQMVDEYIDLIRSHDPEAALVYMAVYTGANVAEDTDETFALCRREDVFILEDCAHVFGARYPDGSLAGTKGDVATFSFHAAKVLNVGEGGCVVCCTDHLRRILGKMTQDYGLDSTWERRPITVGYNWRMPMPQAAVGCTLMRHLDSMLEERKTVARVYDQYIEDKAECLPFVPLHRYIWGESGLDTIGIYKYIIFVPSRLLSRHAVEAITKEAGPYMVAKCNGLNLFEFVEDALFYKNLSRRWKKLLREGRLLVWPEFVNNAYETETELYTTNHFCLPLYNNPEYLIPRVPEVVDRVAEILVKHLEV